MQRFSRLYWCHDEEGVQKEILMLQEKINAMG